LAPAAAQDWPTRPVTMVVPFPPGGGTDVLGRIIGRRLSEILGQQVIIDNVGGAGGMIGSNKVAKATPDGYEFVLGSRADAINQTLYKHPLYDLKQDLAPVILVADQPMAMIARHDLPVDGLQDFIAYVKKNQATMRTGSAGIGSIHHMTMAIFADLVGIDVLHVPYRAGTAMVNGLLTGEIQVAWSGIPNVQALIAGGQLRGYCISVLQRSASTPAIPTCDELGIKGFDVATVMGMFAPAGTAPQIVARLQAEIAKVMREPAMAARMEQLGMVMAENGTADYIAFRQRDAERYAAIVRKLNLQIGK